METNGDRKERGDGNGGMQTRAHARAHAHVRDDGACEAEEGLANLLLGDLCLDTCVDLCMCAWIDMCAMKAHPDA